MKGRKQLTRKGRLALKDRLEYLWGKRPPDAEKGTEHTADGMEVRTPSEAEFMGNLEKVARKPKPPADA